MAASEDWSIQPTLSTGYIVARSQDWRSQGSFLVGGSLTAQAYDAHRVGLLFQANGPYLFGGATGPSDLHYLSTHLSYEYRVLGKPTRIPAKFAEWMAANPSPREAAPLAVYLGARVGFRDLQSPRVPSEAERLLGRVWGVSATLSYEYVVIPGMRILGFGEAGHSLVGRKIWTLGLQNSILFELAPGFSPGVSLQYAWMSGEAPLGTQNLVNQIASVGAVCYFGL